MVLFGLWCLTISSAASVLYNLCMIGWLDGV